MLNKCIFTFIPSIFHLVFPWRRTKRTKKNTYLHFYGIDIIVDHIISMSCHTKPCHTMYTYDLNTRKLIKFNDIHRHCRRGWRVAIRNWDSTGHIHVVYVQQINVIRPNECVNVLAHVQFNETKWSFTIYP